MIYVQKQHNKAYPLQGANEQRFSVNSRRSVNSKQGIQYNVLYSQRAHTAVQLINNVKLIYICVEKYKLENAF